MYDTTNDSYLDDNYSNNCDNNYYNSKNNDNNDTIRDDNNNYYHQIDKNEKNADYKNYNNDTDYIDVETISLIG